jgi:hypothetical protein
MGGFPDCEGAGRARARPADDKETIMGTILFKALLMLAALAPADAHRWTLYLNARFGTRLLYPADLFGRGVESDNGDGISLRAVDGATLAIFGQWNAERESSAQFAARVTQAPAYRGIAYRLVRPTFVVLSGFRGTRAYYERYAFGGRDGAIHAFVLEYPSARRSRYEPIIPRMSASLTWRPVTVR